MCSRFRLAAMLVIALRATGSTMYPTTPGAFPPTPPGGADMFVTRWIRGLGEAGASTQLFVLKLKP